MLSVIRNQIILNGVKVGFIQQDDNGTVWYVSPRKRELHFFRIYGGWGVAKEIVDYLSDSGAFGVKLSILGEHPIWASLSAIKEHGAEVQYAGFEPQIILNERYWNCLQRPLIA